jgi:hypothetical protein
VILPPIHTLRTRFAGRPLTALSGHGQRLSGRRPWARPGKAAVLLTPTTHHDRDCNDRKPKTRFECHAHAAQHALCPQPAAAGAGGGDSCATLPVAQDGELCVASSAFGGIYIEQAAKPDGYSIFGFAEPDSCSYFARCRCPTRTSFRSQSSRIWRPAAKRGGARCYSVHGLRPARDACGTPSKPFVRRMLGFVVSTEGEPTGYMHLQQALVAPRVIETDESGTFKLIPNLTPDEIEKVPWMGSRGAIDPGRAPAFGSPPPALPRAKCGPTSQTSLSVSPRGVDALDNVREWRCPASDPVALLAPAHGARRRTARLRRGRDGGNRKGRGCSITDYLETFYNDARRHSHLGYSSPVEFELRTQVRAVAA